MTIKRLNAIADINTAAAAEFLLRAVACFERNIYKGLTEKNRKLAANASGISTIALR